MRKPSLVASRLNGLAGLVGIAAVACSATVGCYALLDDPPTRRAALLRDPLRGSIELVSTVPLPGPPTGLAVGDDHVAVSVALEGVVLVRRGDARIARRIRINGSPNAIVGDAGRFWVTDLFRDRVLELDDAGRVLSSIHVGRLPGGVAVAAHHVWVLGMEEPSVTVVDRQRLLPPVRMPFALGELWPGAIAESPHGVWLSTDHRRAVTMYDPELWIERGRVAIDGVEMIATTSTGAWTSRWGAGAELVRVDGSTFDAHPVDLPGRVVVTALGGGSVLAVAVRGAVLALDPETGRILARTAVGGGRRLTHVAVDGDDLWAVDANRNVLLRFRLRRQAADGSVRARHGAGARPVREEKR